MRRKAYGKISMYLQVVDRIDKKLQFKNILYPIDLFDMIYLEKNDTMKIETNKHFLPNDRKNTVYRAIQLMKKTYHIEDNFKVKIVKNIPAQSGLGGGSADAACVIRMIDEKYELNLSDEELVDIAKEIDEDTPYCLFNKPAVVTKEGSGIKFIDTNLSFYYVLIKPKYGTSTKRFMRQYNGTYHEEEGFQRCLEALETNNYNQLVNNTHNDFQQVVSKKNKSVNKVIKELQNKGLEGVVMSGSGTSVYGLTKDVELARKTHKELVFKYPFVKYGKI